MYQYPYPQYGLIAGATNAGKNTLIERLVADPELAFERVISMTSRDPRPGEVDGKDYLFRKYAAMELIQAGGGFLENEHVHGKPGEKDRLYGTLLSSVLDPLLMDKNIIQHMDIKGVRTVASKRSEYPEIDRGLFTVFIRISREQAELRFRNRIRQERGLSIDDLTAADAQEIALRLKTLEIENAVANEFSFDLIIDSTTRDQDYAKLREFIVGRAAKHSRFKRAIAP